MSEPKEISSILNNRRKILSQNFFRNDRVVESFLTQLELDASDVVIEIGPGEGVITKQLASRCAHIIAIEKDAILCEKLRKNFSNVNNISIVCADFLRYDVRMRNYKIVANIPFSITSAIVNKIIYSDNPPVKAYLVMQKEAAQKYAGVPRESQYSILAKPWFEFSIKKQFKRTDFTPVPGVDAVLLSVDRRINALVDKEDELLYRSFIKYGFGSWKKNLKTAFRDVFSNIQFRTLAKNLAFSIDATPTELTLEQWLGLFNFFLVGVPNEKRANLLRKDLDVSAPKSQPSGRRSTVGRGAWHNKTGPSIY